MQFKTQPTSPITKVEPESDIQSVKFNHRKLVVSIAKARLPSGQVTGLAVIFQNVRGFRYLDESDLARYWTSTDFSRGFHVLRVEAGGWVTEENNLQGYTAFNNEWLIVTGNGCLSVFTNDVPSYKDVVLEFDT